MCTLNENHMLYGSWNMKYNRQKFLTLWAIFLPFQRLDKLENKNFNIKKTPWDIIILHIYSINGKQCTVPEIWSATDIIFCYSRPFLPFYLSVDPKNQNFLKYRRKHLKILSFYNHKWQSCDVWFLRYGVQQTNVFVILDHFLPFYPLTTQKGKNYKRRRNELEILLLYTCVP